MGLLGTVTIGIIIRPPLACVGLGVVLLSACENTARPPLLWEGEHLRFGTNQDFDMVAEANLEYADAYTGHLKSVLGAPDSLVVDFYWLPEEDGRAPYCERDVTACTQGRAIYSSLIVDEHELVHGVGSYHGDAFIPVEEGLAEYLGDDGEWNRPAVQGDAGDVMAQYGGDAHIPYQYYPRMGHFVSYVVGVYGLDTLMDYARPSDKYESVETTEVHWEDAFGVSLDSTLAEYEQYPVCPAHLFRDDAFDCGRDAVAVISEGMQIEIPIGRQDPDVLGPRYGEIWKTVAVDLSLTGYYSIHASVRGGDTSIRVRMSRCDADCSDASEDPYYEPVLGVFAGWCARSGGHTIRVWAPPEADDVLELGLVPIPSAECPWDR